MLFYNIFKIEMNTRKDKLTQMLYNIKNKYSDEYVILGVPTTMSKNFIAYCAIREDLNLVLKYIAEFKRNSSHLIKSSLTYSIISLYGKCFTDASSSNSPKLEASELFKNEVTNIKTHEYLMDLRHQFIAHRGNTDAEAGLACMLIPKEGGLNKTELKFQQLKLTGFSKKEILNIELLVKTIIKKTEAKINKSGTKVITGMVNQFTPEQLALLSINNVK